MLEVKGLGVSLSSEASVVENISFQLHHREMLSIVGSSGAGKTTICKAIMGLLGTAYRTSGEILFQQENLLGLPERKRWVIYGREICLIMQNPMTAFNPSIRVGRQLEKLICSIMEKRRDRKCNVSFPVFCRGWGLRTLSGS